MSPAPDFERPDARPDEALRKIVITPKVNPYAEGSAVVCFGGTKVHCTATVEAEIPRWMEPSGQGWITAEYGMLPRSTHTRSRREAASGRQGGRTMEIQRLVGRALRRAVDLGKLGEVTIRLDCDVLCADGGTRTAAISGGWVALYQALLWMVEGKMLDQLPPISHVAAVSVGKVHGRHLLDLCYDEDASAEFDLNVVCNGANEIIEVQGTGEEGTLSLAELNEMLTLATKGIQQIIEEQKRAIAAC